MLSEFAWVGGTAPKKRPYWLEQAEITASGYPLFERPLMHDWQRVVRDTKVNGIRKANQRLDAIRRQFKFGDFRIDQTDDTLVNDYAKSKSQQCIRLLAGWMLGRAEQKEAAAAVAGLINHHGLYYNWDDLLEKDKLQPLLMRFQDQAWWRRKIRRVAAQRIEAISRELGFVNRARGIYCSDIGRQEFKRRKQLNLAMMEHTVLENELGEQFTLADLAALSNANPMIRRTELMVRIAGFEEYAKELGYEGWFFTITCPSKYHAAHQFGGRNDKFCGFTQRDAQNYLCDLWSRFRAKAKRNEWRSFGFRVAEPHHDGTPHWHLLLFIHPDDALAFGGALRRYALKEDGNEPGAWRARFKAEKIKEGINPATGKEYSAAGYIAKYIAKSIDGEHVEQDLYGEDAKASAVNICTWASRNGIRQFQQLGGPSVTAWRELRRLGRLSEEALAEQPPLIKAAVEELERLNQESAASAWAWFCRFADENGKISLWRIVKTAEETLEAIDEDSGEIYEITSQKPLINHYRELLEKDHGIRVMGINETLYVQTRFHTWEVVSATPAEAEAIHQRRTEERNSRAAAAALRRAERDAACDVEGATAPPWTGVNNCTGGTEPPDKPEPAPQQILLIS